MIFKCEFAVNQANLVLFGELVARRLNERGSAAADAPTYGLECRLDQPHT
ncbi:MAG: hypothetical protein ACE5GO_01855 [Anaerolineales bacterium]